MIIKDAKIGMLVYISRNCNKTSSIHGWTTTMSGYQGTEQAIKAIGGTSIWIKGWQWHPDDLSIVKKEEIKEQFFNEEQIWA